MGLQTLREPAAHFMIRMSTHCGVAFVFVSFSIRTLRAADQRHRCAVVFALLQRRLPTNTKRWSSLGRGTFSAQSVVVQGSMCKDRPLSAVFFLPNIESTGLNQDYKREVDEDIPTIPLFRAGSLWPMPNVLRVFSCQHIS